MFKQKNLIFIGAPGAGKGTISALVLAEQPLVHISTGDLLRDEIKRDTQLGREASTLMKAGKLVPDEVVAGMVRSRLSQPDCRKEGFILDGFPRTIRQAELLADALRELGTQLDRVVYLKVDDDLLLQRLTARQNCRKCGAIYNKIFQPSKQENICDKCGGNAVQRKDDAPETVIERLKTYHVQTAPLADFYAAKGKLTRVKGLDGVEATSKVVLEALNA